MIRPGTSALRTLKSYFEQSELALVWPRVNFERVDRESIEISFLINGHLDSGQLYTMTLRPPNEENKEPLGLLSCQRGADGRKITGSVDPLTFLKIVQGLKEVHGERLA